MMWPTEITPGKVPMKTGNLGQKKKVQKISQTTFERPKPYTPNPQDTYFVIIKKTILTMGYQRIVRILTG